MQSFRRTSPHTRTRTRARAAPVGPPRARHGALWREHTRIRYPSATESVAILARSLVPPIFLAAAWGRAFLAGRDAGVTFIGPGLLWLHRDLAWFLCRDIVGLHESHLRPQCVATPMPCPQLESAAAPYCTRDARSRPKCSVLVRIEADD